MVVHAIAFARTRRAAVEQHERLQPAPQFRVQPGQGRSEWTLPDTGWPGENDEASLPLRAHVAPFIDLSIVLVSIGFKWTRSAQSSSPIIGRVQTSGCPSAEEEAA